MLNTESITLFGLSALLLLAAPGGAGGQDGAPDPDTLRALVREYRQQHEAEIVRELAGLLAIPNVASDVESIRRNAEQIAGMMRRRGIEARLLETEGGPPVVYGELISPGAAHTVTVYAHYDGQPAVAADWDGEPWEPLLRDAPLEQGGEVIPWSSLGERVDGEWRLYARSAGDDKAPIVAWLVAVDALREAGIALSVNVKFFFEGEEEAGSPHLPAFLREHRDLLRGDALLLCDGPVHQSRRMQLFFGARGIVGLEVTTYGPARALHSGHYGNWAPNPIALLVDLLASMRDIDGRILIDGFYDDVRPPSESERRALAAVPDPDEELRRELALAWSEAGGARLAERIMMPALNLRGVESGGVGAQAKNAIPTEAVASIGFRLVPDQTPARVRRLVEEHIRGRGYHIVYDEPDLETRLAHPRIIRLRWGQGYPPARTPLDLPVSRALINVIESALGEPPIVMPTLGGSVPMYLFNDVLETPTIGLPIANHDNNQHAANENLRIRNLWDAIDIFAAVLAGLGHNL